MQQFDINGIFIPTFGIFAVVSLVVSQLLNRALARVGFYRLVWHRPLFNIAFYITILGTSIFLYNRFLQ
ncbi:DUF1656 domain-containing protein [Maridesulfovibrio bastinii]|uniref:DUF1656 domain-containing protein n=1 Tax=Maridesulfovibrio bastinii TaxID=47157 RepID=UPI000484EEE7|nr:DUF1656 domain-containing protein [Maridesulfovibrio bastinii]